VLLAAFHAAGDFSLLERPFEGLGDLADELFLIAARPLQFPFENLVPVGLQRPEA
jgi:hypothetical protein